MVSRTGWISVEELEMTRSTFAVAVCCSSNSVRSEVRWRSSFSSRGFRRAREGNEHPLLEGYNSAQVLDPFRKKEGATVKAESLTNDPTMINRVRAGETNVWDLINVNNPWARKVMWPAKLIKPLPRDQFEPYFEKMLPTSGRPINGR